MHTPTRTILPFDPRAELQARWPEWVVVVTPMRTGELWLRRERMVLIPAEAPDLVRLSLAHVCGHLALEHPIGATEFTAAEESEADWWARLHLQGIG